jgi:diguanylate cyclase (GGDEF)-like protein
VRRVRGLVDRYGGLVRFRRRDYIATRSGTRIDPVPRDEQVTAVTAVTDVTEQPLRRAGSDCLVVIYSEQKSLLGRRFRLENGPVRLGRELDNEIVLREKSVSRRHARIERSDDGWSLVDSGSSNGTRLNDRELSGRRRLERDDRIKVGSTIFKYLSGSDVESAFHEEIYQLSIVDHLTGLRNRRAFEDEFEREFSRARRYDRKLSLVMIDIDHFKGVNDDWGHPAGDQVLAQVASVLHSRLQQDEMLARYGGEEFVLVLAETTAVRAHEFAEELRALVASTDFYVQGERLGITISLGCAELRETDKSGRALLQRADEKLYESKNAGRNRVSS